MVSTIDLFQKSNIKILLIIITTLGATVFDLYGQVSGVSIFAPLLFFLPIILAAYWFPREGVLFAVAIGVLELVIVSQFSYMDLAPLTYATATASFYVLIAVSVVVSALSGNLRDQEARYQAIFDGAHAGVLLVEDEKDPKIAEVNRSASMILGYTPQEIAGERLNTIWQDKQSLTRVCNDIPKEKSISNIESCFFTKDGRELPVLVTIACIPGKKLVVTFMDITSLVEAEKDLKKRNTQLSTVNEVIAVTSTSASVEELFRRSYEKICYLFRIDSGGFYLVDDDKGFLIARFLSGKGTMKSPLPPQISVDTPPFSDILKNGNVFFAGTRSAGTEPNSTELRAIVPLCCESRVIGVLCLVTMDDVSFTKDDLAVLGSVGKEIGCAVQKLHLSDELLEANRKANLYLDILVHDINNANLASLGYGELLTEMLTGKEKEMAVKMIEGVMKSREVIRNLDTIRHIQEKKAELKPVNLDNLIKSEIRHYPGARIQYEDSCCSILADDLLGEVMTNLIGNSVKFGGNGVEVHIKSEPIPDGLVRVSIIDNGPGIPDTLKSVIFNRFQTGKEKDSGKGLGLYITKTLVERYGGNIIVEDRIPGRYEEGTVISFTLKKAS